MNSTRFAFEWGIGGIFGAPVAFSFGAMGDGDGSCFGVHVGPLYFIVSWSAA